MKKLLSVLVLAAMLLPLAAAPKKGKNTTSNAPSWAQFAINDNLIGAKTALDISTEKQAFIIKVSAANQKNAYAQAVFSAYKKMIRLFAEELISQKGNMLIGPSFSYKQVNYSREESSSKNPNSKKEERYVGETLSVENIIMYHYSQKNDRIEDYFMFPDSILSKTGKELDISDLSDFISAFNRIFPELSFTEEGSYTTDANSGSMCILVYSYNKNAFETVVENADVVEQEYTKMDYSSLLE